MKDDQRAKEIIDQIDELNNLRLKSHSFDKVFTKYQTIETLEVLRQDIDDIVEKLIKEFGKIQYDKIKATKQI